MDFFSWYCWIQSVGGALVDSLKALSVLHRHEEFLSQVLEGFITGQIQAVKTEKKKKKKGEAKLEKQDMK